MAAASPAMLPPMTATRLPRIRIANAPRPSRARSRLHRGPPGPRARADRSRRRPGPAPPERRSRAAAGNRQPSVPRSPDRAGPAIPRGRRPAPRWTDPPAAKARSRSQSNPGPPSLVTWPRLLKLLDFAALKLWSAGFRGRVMRRELSDRRLQQRTRCQQLGGGVGADTKFGQDRHRVRPALRYSQAGGPRIRRTEPQQPADLLELPPVRGLRRSHAAQLL